MKKVRLDSYFLFITIVFIFTLTFMGNEIFRQIEFITLPSFMLFMIFLFFLVVSKVGFNKRTIYTLIPFAILEVLFIANFESEFNWIVNQFIYMIIIYVFSNISWSKKQIWIISMLASAMLIIFLFLSFFYENNELLISIPFMESSPNANGIAAWMYLMSYFPLLYILNYSKRFTNLKVILVFTILIVGIINLNTRSVMLSYISWFGTYLLWPFITKNIRNFKIFFINVLIFIFGFIFFAINSGGTGRLSILLNEVSRNLTGKALFSSRNEIWMIISEYIKIKPLFGYGSGVHFDDLVFWADITSHNLYLEITLQLGIIGLVVLLVLLYYIYKYFWVNHNDNRVRLGGSFFVSLLILQLVELTLLQTSVLMGMITWFVIGFSMNFSSDEDYIVKQSGGILNENINVWKRNTF